MKVQHFSSVVILDSLKWCVIHKRLETPSEWSRCDQAGYEAGGFFTPFGPMIMGEHGPRPATPEDLAPFLEEA
jgi:hypothetical protein